MYDELVKQLRDNAEFLVKASSGCLSNSFAETMNQAADAIEELQKRVPKRPHGRLVGADRLLSEHMKQKYYHLPNGDIAIPIIDVENAPTVLEAEEDE